MLKCEFCEKECKSENSQRNHQRLCKKNPHVNLEHLISIEHARKSASQPVRCSLCGVDYAKGSIKRHEAVCNLYNVTCTVCNTNFKKTYLKQIYCSSKCANNATKYKPRKDNTYQTICFQYHGKKCLVCDEVNIVAAHHYNHNHKDNRPENLVPLCPTHHSYMHSSFKYLIEDKVDDYVRRFIDNLSLV